jgi:16S rRNA U516 pseudouridylate synthase RsuA-like enzyme
MMSKEISARFEITRTYYVTTYGNSEEECYDNLDHVKEEDYEFSDQQVELIETEYAGF